MLDGMQQVLTGSGPFFDEAFYNELVSCMNQFDPMMLQVTDAQWKGMKIAICSLTIVTTSSFC